MRYNNNFTVLYEFVIHNQTYNLYGLKAFKHTCTHARMHASKNYHTFPIRKNPNYHKNGNENDHDDDDDDDCY